MNLDEFERALYEQFPRFRSMPCCQPGWRIQRGLAWAAEQGFWTGGSPPYGLRRLLLDKQGKPLYLLAPGQRKATRKQRVTLVLGEAAKVAAVRRVFREFVDLGYSVAQIADGRADRVTPRRPLDQPPSARVSSYQKLRCPDYLSPQDDNITGQSRSMGPDKCR